MLALVKLVGLVLLVDFLSGLFHWLEDAYGQEHWPVTGKLITQANILHHHEPSYFTRHGWFHSARVLLVMGALVLLGAALLGALTWQVLFVVAIGVNANEVHKWAHRSRSENGPFISYLQDIGLLQSRRHHARHHRDGKNTHYCVLTNHLNPILEAVRLWPVLEWVIFALLGVKRRPDTSVAPTHRQRA